MSSAAFSSASFSTPSASSPYKPSSKKRGRGVSEPHPVLCPICSVHFRAAPEPSVPHRLPCAHCVCLPCLEAYALSDEEGCPVCRKPAEPHVLDLTLASYAEDVYLQASGGACPAAAVDAAGTIGRRQPRRAGPEGGTRSDGLQGRLPTPAARRRPAAGGGRDQGSAGGTWCAAGAVGSGQWAVGSRQ